MKKMLVLVMVVAFVATSVFVAVADNGPAEIKMSAKMGDVTFNHVKHQGGNDCAVCHHTGGYESCKSCHGAKPDAPKSKKAYHKLCKNCHKKQSGPTKCKQCHVK